MTLDEVEVLSGKKRNLSQLQRGKWTSEVTLSRSGIGP